MHLQIQILQKSSELKKSRVSDELTRVNNARNCEAPSEVLIEVADFDYLEYNLLTLELSALRGEDCVVGDVPSLADVRNSVRLRSPPSFAKVWLKEKLELQQPGSQRPAGPHHRGRAAALLRLLQLQRARGRRGALGPARVGQQRQLRHLREPRHDQRSPG